MAKYTRLTLPREEVLIDKSPTEILEACSRAMDSTQPPVVTDEGVTLPAGWFGVTDIGGDTIYLNAFQAALAVRGMSEERLEEFKASQVAGTPMYEH